MAGFCRVECLETREQSLEDALYQSAWDEPCSCNISWRILVEELILYVEISWSCWIACGNTVVLVEYTVFEENLVGWIVCGNTTVLEED